MPESSLFNQLSIHPCDEQSNELGIGSDAVVILEGLELSGSLISQIDLNLNLFGHAGTDAFTVYVLNRSRGGVQP